MTKIKKRKLKIYEVGIPIKERWVYLVQAYNKKEAWKKANDSQSDGSAEQIYSLTGTKKFVIKRKESKS